MLCWSLCTVGRDRTEPLGGLLLLSGEDWRDLERRGSGFMPTEKVHIRSPAARWLGPVEGEVEPGWNLFLLPLFFVFCLFCFVFSWCWSMW